VRLADYRAPVSANSPCRTLNPVAVREEPGPNGQHVCVYHRFRETLPGGRSYEVLDQGISEGDNTGVYVVPEGNYFMMGDNRDDSEDSRFPTEVGGVGLLPVENLLGRVLVTFWSTDGSAEWIKPWTWFTAARWSRIGRTG